MRLQSAVFYLFCLLVLISACKEQDDDTPCPPDPDIVYIDSMMHPYMFARGSQWIYQNESDSTGDTVTQDIAILYIYEETMIHGTGNQTGGCPTSVYRVEYFSSGYQHTLYWISQSSDRRTSNTTFGTNISQNGIHGGYLFMADLPVGEERGKARVEAHYDSLTIGNHTFQHVTQMYAGAEQWMGWSLRLYYAPNVGVVRREYLHADTVANGFNLVDWHVTPYR
jgi:hypothetical protein